MINVFITGGTGFVGSHLVEKAVNKGYNVFALVRKSSNISHLKSLNVNLLYAELIDEVGLNSVFKNLKVKIDYVFHCAALTKAKDLNHFNSVNVDATKRILRLLKRFQPDLKKFIFVSSLAACGPTNLDRIITLENRAPITDYGVSKLAAEDFLKNTDVPYIIFRPTAVFGPKEKDIFVIFDLINKGINPLIGSHKQQLTFIYVKDLVNVFLRSIEVEIENKTYFVTDGNTYNKEDLGKFVNESLNKKARLIKIPLGVVKSLAYLIQTIFKLGNKLAPLNMEKYKELKAESWVCNDASTTVDFEYKYKYTLETGVKETVSWYLKEGWLKK